MKCFVSFLYVKIAMIKQIIVSSETNLILLCLHGQPQRSLKGIQRLSTCSKERFFYKKSFAAKTLLFPSYYKLTAFLIFTLPPLKPPVFYFLHFTLVLLSTTPLTGMPLLIETGAGFTMLHIGNLRNNYREYASTSDMSRVIPP